MFCTLKEGGGQGSFTVIPPESANYVLKIYAGPEQLLDDNEGALDHVVSFLLKCEKVRLVLLTTARVLFIPYTACVATQFTKKKCLKTLVYLKEAHAVFCSLKQLHLIRLLIAKF